MQSRGFTLIELLIVISVMALLAGTIMNFYGMRDDARDSRIINALGQAASITNTIGIMYNSYSGACASETTFNSIEKLDLLGEDIIAAGGNLTCQANTNNYCFSSSLVKESEKHYCVTKIRSGYASGPCENMSCNFD